MRKLKLKLENLSDVEVLDRGDLKTLIAGSGNSYRCWCSGAVTNCFVASSIQAATDFCRTNFYPECVAGSCY